MAKKKSENPPRPTEDIRVEKPVFKATLSAMIKKPPVPQNKSKK